MPAAGAKLRRYMQIDLPPSTQLSVEQITNRMPSSRYGVITAAEPRGRDYAATRRAERNCSNAVFSATGATWTAAMADLAEWTTALRR